MTANTVYPLLSRNIVAVFSLTLMLSAGLLFSVQPMFGKMILPLLGGTPAVWNTLMVFFQVVLLAGYAYAHFTSKWLAIPKQAALHIVVLGLCLFVLPIQVTDLDVGNSYETPIRWIMGAAMLKLGGPFFALAAMAPMIQRWFTASGHKDADNPYFLYAASNIGSMGALIAYPFVFEPIWSLSAQSHNWMFGFIGLVAMICLSYKALPKPVKTAPIPNSTSKSADAPTPKDYGFWLLLSFVPSSLLLGVTTHITTDVATVPLLWIIPLILYLMTFVIAFARKPLIAHQWVLHLQMFCLIVFLIFECWIKGAAAIDWLSMYYGLGIHYTLFFFTALMCHGELIKKSPPAQYLTHFYLTISVGGALGGIFNTLIAPFIFDTILEYYLILAFSFALRFSSRPILIPAKHWLVKLLHAPETIVLASILPVIYLAMSLTYADYVPVILALSLGTVLLHQSRKVLLTFSVLCFLSTVGLPSVSYDKEIIFQERNFFGVIKVYDSHVFKARFLQHNTTVHGVQPLPMTAKPALTAYYEPKSTPGQVFSYFDNIARETNAQHIAAIGLGSGGINCFTAKNRRYTFFEIDPMMAAVAENPNYFTFLSNCTQNSGIILGDGRLKLAEQPDRSYDMIFLDAFSSDNIPIHLLTLEAIELYFQKLKKNGVLIAHISNRYLDLHPVLASAGEELGLHVIARSCNFSNNCINEKGLYATGHSYVVMSYNQNTIDYLTTLYTEWFVPGFPDGFRTWTDDYSNILSVLY